MGISTVFAQEERGTERNQGMSDRAISADLTRGVYQDKLTPMFPVLTPTQLESLAQRLFQNECGGKRQHLVYWSPHEPFPSLGIAHFIWLPKSQQNQPYLQTFPQLYRALSQNTSIPPPPQWLTNLTPFLPPWDNRAQFLQAQQHPKERQKIVELSDWLWQTRQQQASFVVQHFQYRLNQVLKTLPLAQKQAVLSKLSALQASPEGFFAMLDYSNFKGIGHNPKEQYQGKGWGLIEVLEVMRPLPNSTDNATKDNIQAFIMAAKQVLQRRVDNAPKPEQQWLKGWYKRIERYAQPTMF